MHLRSTLGLGAALSLCLSLAACGNNDNNPSTNNTTPGDMAGDMTTPGDMGGDMPTPGDMGDMGTPTDMGDMTTMPPTDQFTVETCQESVPAAPAGQLCSVTPGDGARLIQGTVLGDGKVYENGSVLIDASGAIACVGCGCAAQAGGATVVACAEGVISPGLINAHDHITYNAKNAPRDHGTERFDHRNDWRGPERGHNRISSGTSDTSKIGIMVAELRMVFGGATSIAGSGGAVGMLRNLDRSGEQRGEGMDGTLDVEYETFPLGSNSNLLIAEGCDRYSLTTDYDPNGIFLPHVAEGIDKEARNEYTCLAGGIGSNLITNRTTMIHGVGLTAADIADAGSRGAKLVWSPRTNIDLYGQTADVLTYRRSGVTVALGTDWIHSGSMNMLREFACVDNLNTTYYNKALTDYDIWRMATGNAAEALGVDAKLGALSVGKMGDVAIFNGRERKQHRAVIGADVADVALVLRSGKALYGDAALVDGLHTAEDAAQCDTIDVCTNSRKVCVKLDADVTLAEVTERAAYALFFCGQPESEPSCTPLRPDEYTGVPSATDADGDGIADAQDNCPAYFNPPRPLEDNTQPNADGDTFGDICDVCPTSGPGDTCTPFDPNDRDADGIANDADNCPTTPNADQADGDNDDIGDVCDPCPDAANPGFSGCPALVYNIKTGQVPVGTRVSLKDMVVSAVGTDGFFIQLDPTSGDYTSADHSGVFVFARGYSPMPAEGDRVTIDAVTSEFSSQVQLGDIKSLTVTSSGARPTPAVVTEAEILAAGAKGKVYEGLLVRVENVQVAELDTGTNMSFAKYKLGGGLFVDDALFDVIPLMSVGANYSALVGGVSFRFSENHLMPSGAADIISGPPALAPFSAASAIIASGTTGPTTPALAVRLNQPATAATTITLTYSDAAVLTGPASVTIPQGQQEVELSLQAVAASGTTQTITASYDGKTETVSVTVFDSAAPRSIAQLDPPTATIAINGAQTFTVTLDYPAPAGGEVVTLSAAPGTSATVPATVTVPAGQLSVTFDATATATAGSETITASVAGGSQEVATLTVNTAPANCLVISEYVEGSSNNKAIELYNCGTSATTASSYGICLRTNANVSGCTNTLILGDAIAPGGVYGICNGSLALAVDATDCNVSSSVANFNGDDRLFVFEDANGNGDFDEGSDPVVDALGLLGTAESGRTWENMTLRRCNFSPFDGTGTFDFTAYYTQHPNDDVADFGVVPVSGCP